MPTLISAEGVFGFAEADSVLVEGGRVQNVGRRSQLISPLVREERFPGGTIIGGLADAHFHPVGYTGALRRVVLKNASDMDDLVERLRAATTDLAPGESLIGIRLDDESLAERALPTRHELDRAADDRPILIYRYCGHIAVANTVALAAAGVDKDTPDPFGGIIDRDETGVPTGVLRETAIGSAATSVGDRASGLSPGDVAEASRLLARMGLTAVGAIVTAGGSLWCDGADELGVLVDSAPELAVPMPVLVATESAEELDTAAERLARAGRRVWFHGVKLFADGSLGGHTAAMVEPFADRPGERGTHRLPTEVAMPVAQRSLDRGGIVAIHAIGDAAVGHVLDIFELLIEGGADPDHLRMEHVSVIGDDDIERMAKLGVTASVQPAFLASETEWLPKRLGPERTALAYRFRALLDAGVPIAGGSDCPVEPPHPLHGVAAAVHRHGISPQEALTASEALSTFTEGAARAMGMPAPLAAGSPANLVVVDRDPVTLAARELRNVDVLGTFVDGESPALPATNVDWVG